MHRAGNYRVRCGLTIDQLEAEDNTSCLWVLTNIRLRTTYTIFEGEFQGRIERCARF